jgi:hypothetical protein
MQATMRKLRLPLLLLAVSPLTFAASPFLRESSEVRNEKLYVGLKLRGDCPFSERDARRAIDGELSRAGVTASKNWKDAFLFVAVTCIENEGPDREIFGYSQFVETSWCGLAYPEHLDELDSIMACDMESGRWQTRTAGRDDKAYFLDGIRKATADGLQTFKQQAEDR